MNGGRVEQLGTPHEIYDHPRTSFVADFIGSLNALELTVDELVGDYAVARFGDGDRVVAPVEAGHRAGASLRVAVRPEQVQIDPLGSTVPADGSRLTGTIRELVYLGMYTQFHVDTAAGRIVSHRLADEASTELESGSGVTLSWAPEHAFMLADASSDL
jgi:ABC-type Fe3+/spermidine/putrescine transport system ATPase subunit